MAASRDPHQRKLGFGAQPALGVELPPWPVQFGWGVGVEDGVEQAGEAVVDVLLA